MSKQVMTYETKSFSFLPTEMHVYFEVVPKECIYHAHS